MKTDTRQFIQLWSKAIRLGASLFALVIIFFTRYGLDLPIPILPLLGLPLVILAYNLFFFLIESRISPWLSTLMIGLAAFLDLTIIGLTVYFTGGLTSPALIFFPIPLIGFAITVASLWPVILLVFWALLVYPSVYLLPLLGWLPPGPHFLATNEPRYIVVQAVVLAAALGITSFLVTWLINVVEKNEAQVISSTRQLEQAEATLRQNVSELTATNRKLVAREMEMIELKAEIVTLEKEAGRRPN
ncbi:MAG: hypothetical protein MUC35_00495 [Candidatus Margulisbacteria bacterium]|nr:hypothetical protein [Candidatus Margulisiibacteriota bacterium]